jgi:hypothetical protein
MFTSILFLKTTRQIGFYLVLFFAGDVVYNKTGRRIRFVTIAVSKVKDVNQPNA